MLKRFFRPKWQHRNAQVRKQALLRLSPGDREILEKVALEDEAPELRGLALRRLSSFALLRRVAASDADATVRDSAQRRYRQLLVGAGEDTGEAGPTLGERLGVVSELTDTEMLEHILRKGAEPELRQAALPKVERESVLREVAGSDPVLDIRLAALERINGRAALERLVRETRTRDKHVSRRAREKLDALIAESERPARVRERARKLCASVEVLGKSGAWIGDQKTLIHLESQWQALEAPPEPSLEERFQRAKTAFHAGYEAQRKVDEQADAARRARKSLLDALEQIGTETDSIEALDSEGSARLRRRVDELEHSWRTLDLFEDAEAQSLERDFRRAVSRQREHAEARQKEFRRQALAEELCVQAEALAAQKTPVQEREFTKLERRWSEAGAGAGDVASESGARFEAAVATLRQRAEQAQRKREQELERLPVLLEELEQSLDAGEIRKAGSLHDQIQARIKNLRDARISKQHIAPLQARFNTALPRLRELQNWRSWAATGARERLCEEMQAVIDADLGPQEKGDKVRAAQAEWKSMGLGERAGNAALWQRFQTLCREAYEPYRLWQGEQAAMRKANHEEKIALCERAEGIVAEQDGPDIDWKTAAREARQLRNAWRQVGPVENARRRGLEHRFNTVLGPLEERLRRERERNKAHRESLLEAAKALVESDDVDAAIRETKRLQREWKPTVAGVRKQEQALWESFRSACDAVYARRAQQLAEQDREQQENLKRRQVLCDEMEILCKASAEELGNAKERVQQIRGEWNAIGPSPKAETAQVEERLERSRQDFSRHCEVLAMQADRRSLDELRERAALCRELEMLHGETSGLEVLARVRARWDALPALPRDTVGLAIEERFEIASAALEDVDARQRLAAARSDNLLARERLCLHMEVLAGVESPPEAAEARLRYQAERLSAAMKGSDARTEGDALEFERMWYTVGPPPSDCMEELEARFRRSCEAALRQDS